MKKPNPPPPESSDDEAKMADLAKRLLSTPPKPKSQGVGRVPKR